MNDCLVTRLKGVVNNDSLLHLGEMVLEVNANETTPVMNFGSFVGQTITVSGTVQLWNNAESQRFDNNGEFTPDSSNVSLKAKGGAEGGKIHIPTKYSLDALQFAGKPTESLNNIMNWFSGSYETVNLISLRNEDVLSPFEGKTGIAYFEATGLNSTDKTIRGDLSSLATSRSTLEVVAVRDSLITGNIANISNPNLKTIHGWRCNISGDIQSLGICTQLTYVNIFNSKCSGTIEDFVKAQIAAGRTAATGITFIVVGTQITFKGAISTDFNATLSWTSNGSTATITYGGVSETISL